jgi:SAM-dependent methyltransferase
MKMTDRETAFMNGWLWHFRQRHLALNVFRLLGLSNEVGKDILEVWCGSGFGATILQGFRPNSYVGIDLAEDQINRARKRGLVGYDFHIMDATDMRTIPNESKDVVVVFTILHHVPKWRDALKECGRVLRPAGKIFVEEPNRAFINVWDSIVHWDHPKDALFSYGEFRQGLEAAGFRVVNQVSGPMFASWCGEKLVG